MAGLQSCGGRAAQRVGGHRRRHAGRHLPSRSQLLRHVLERRNICNTHARHVGSLLPRGIRLNAPSSSAIGGLFPELCVCFVQVLSVIFAATHSTRTVL